MQVAPNVSDVSALATGQRTVESTSTGQTFQPVTEVASIIQAARHFLDQQEEIRMEDEEEDDNNLITELSEVQSYSEIDNGPVHAGVNVKGRLRRHLEFWKRIGAPEYILSVIRDGYRCHLFSFLPAKI